MIEELRIAFERDDPFTMGEDECYFNTETGNVTWVGDGLSSVRPVGRQWVKVPGTPHSEWHEVFKEWLIEIDQAGIYTTSIGLTLKELSKIDQNFKYSWYDKKSAYAEKKAKEWIEKHEPYK